MLYRTTYNLTLRQHGEKLYHGVKDVVSAYLEQTAEEVIVPAFSGTAEKSGADEGAIFLKTVKRVWDDYTTAMDMIQKVLYYLVMSASQFILHRLLQN